MLIDEQNPNILPLDGEMLESLFDGRVIRLAIHHEEVLLGIRRRRNVLCFIPSVCSSVTSLPESRVAYPDARQEQASY